VARRVRSAARIIFLYKKTDAARVVVPLGSARPDVFLLPFLFSSPHDKNTSVYRGEKEKKRDLTRDNNLTTIN
jgi:hypothetical protein